MDLTLVKDWNDTPAGTSLRVLGPGESPEPGTVDARRAAQLLADGLAVEGEAAAAVKPPRKGARRG